MRLVLFPAIKAVVSLTKEDKDIKGRSFSLAPILSFKSKFCGEKRRNLTNKVNVKNDKIMRIKILYE